MQKIFKSLIAHISGMVGEISLNFECGFSWVEGSSIINLVPCGLNIKQSYIYMHENHNFVLPVNILTVLHTLFLGRHNTLLCVFKLPKGTAIMINQCVYQHSGVSFTALWILIRLEMNIHNPVAWEFIFIHIVHVGKALPQVQSIR